MSWLEIKKIRSEGRRQGACKKMDSMYSPGRTASRSRASPKFHPGSTTLRVRWGTRDKSARISDYAQQSRPIREHAVEWFGNRSNYLTGNRILLSAEVTPCRGLSRTHL